jgi:hypothetical protein
MERNTILVFVILQLFLISSLIVIATNQNDDMLNNQNDASSFQECSDCSNTCIDTCKEINDHCGLCDKSCVNNQTQSKNNLNKCEGTCSNLGNCGQNQKNYENCQKSSECSGQCLS